MDVLCFQVTRDWYHLRFNWSPDPTLKDAIKEIPGTGWVKDKRVWSCPNDAFDAVIDNVAAAGLPATKFHVRAIVPEHDVHIPAHFTKGLRDYQLEAVRRLTGNSGYMLSWEMRVGKTKPTAAALATHLYSGAARTGIILYPNSVRPEWQRQLKEQTGITMLAYRPKQEWDAAFIMSLASVPGLVIGIHYEVLTAKLQEILLGIVEQRPGRFILVADEIQNIKNRKAGRAKVAFALAEHEQCGWRWGLSGTPVRNKPRDLWGVLNFLHPGSVGTYWKYAIRYADAQEGAYGWSDDGVSNAPELAKRLRNVSWRLLRSDVAKHLPKSDRQSILCQMSSEQLAKYQKHEKVLGPAALKAMDSNDPMVSLAALRELSQLTAESKLEVLAKEITGYAESGHKLVVFANFHATLRRAIEHAIVSNTVAFGDENAAQLPDAPRGFVAGGWLGADERHAAINAWKACQGPAVLYVNILSSGVGIDLSQAEAAIFLEASWVPADVLQAEARIVDVHQGTRTSPPVFLYLLTEHSIDADMGTRLLEKLRAIDAVVGTDVESTGLGAMLKSSKLVDTSRLGLASTGAADVNAALDAMRARLLGEDGAFGTVPTEESETDNAVDTDDGTDVDDAQPDDAEEIA